MINDEQFERKVKACLDASLENNLGALDADTRKRLADSRNKALKSQALKSQALKSQALKSHALNSQSQCFAWLNPNYYLPAGALALCSLFAVILVLNPQDKGVQALQNDQVAVFELLNNADELEAMTDPDFYVWIDEGLNESSADEDV